MSKSGIIAGAAVAALMGGAIAAFAVVIAALAIRPNGLLGRAGTRKV